MDLNDMFLILRKRIDQLVSNKPDEEIWDFINSYKSDVIEGLCKRIVSGKFW